MFSKQFVTLSSYVVFVIAITSCHSVGSSNLDSPGNSRNGVGSTTGLVDWTCSNLDQYGAQILEFRSENQAGKPHVSMSYLIPEESPKDTSKWLELNHCDIVGIDSQFSMACTISDTSDTLKLVKTKDQKPADLNEDFPGKDYPQRKVLASFMATLTIPKMTQFKRTNFSKIYCSATRSN